MYEVEKTAGLGSLGYQGQGALQPGVASTPSVLSQVQDAQAKAIAELEMQIKDLAAKLQPFLYEGPTNQSEREAMKTLATPPSVLSSHLITISGHTQQIHALSRIVGALRDAVVR